MISDSGSLRAAHLKGNDVFALFLSDLSAEFPLLPYISMRSSLSRHHDCIGPFFAPPGTGLRPVRNSTALKRAPPRGKSRLYMTPRAPGRALRRRISNKVFGNLHDLENMKKHYFEKRVRRSYLFLSGNLIFPGK